MKKPLTVDQHLELARLIRRMRYFSTEVRQIVWEHFGTGAKATRLSSKIENVVRDLRSELDHHYHEQATEAEFKTHGHVYYWEEK
jgi:hypothetical protein